MKQLKIFKLIAIVSYLLIILMGQIVGLPFFFWLLFTLFDFGNIDQLFAFLAVIGLIISYTTVNSLRTSKILICDVLCLFLLASPIIRRMSAVLVTLFNYWLFITPTIMFGLFYSVSICYSVRQYKLQATQ